MQIHVFHDTACPWCRIGKAHLKTALAQWDGEPVTVQYHTFFLNATIPVEGAEFRSYMLAKGGHQVPLEAFFDGPRRAGAAAGLTFNFEAITTAPNTLLSHRLIALTPPDRKEAIIDAIYAAYFEHGQDIGDLDVLVDVAVKTGWDAAEIHALLVSDTAEAAVKAEAQQAQELGVTGVPFFVVDNLFAFSGAQAPETILQVLRQAVDMRGEVETQQ